MWWGGLRHRKNDRERSGGTRMRESGTEGSEGRAKLRNERQSHIIVKRAREIERDRDREREREAEKVETRRKGLHLQETAGRGGWSVSDQCVQIIHSFSSRRTHAHAHTHTHTLPLTPLTL